MKVLPVSLSFKSKYVPKNYDYSFLYNKNDTENKNENLIKGYKIATALTAATAVLIALFRIGRKKRFPDNIVDIADKTKGLNKINNQERAIDLIKSKFLYPIKATLLGDKDISKSQYFKSGLVITGEDKNALVELNSALTEHVNIIDIKTLILNTTASRTKDGKTYTRPLKKNEVSKLLRKVIAEAKENYSQTGQYTMINIGNLDNATSMHIVKTKQSKVDKMLADITNSKAPGIIWTGWTTNSKSLPLFFRELPVLVVKLE